MKTYLLLAGYEKDHDYAEMDPGSRLSAMVKRRPSSSLE